MFLIFGRNSYRVFFERDILHLSENRESVECSKELWVLGEVWYYRSWSSLDNRMEILQRFVKNIRINRNNSKVLFQFWSNKHVCLLQTRNTLEERKKRNTFTKWLKRWVNMRKRLKWRVENMKNEELCVRWCVPFSKCLQCFSIQILIHQFNIYIYIHPLVCSFSQ
jgi:hypothetical protein